MHSAIRLSIVTACSAFFPQLVGCATDDTVDPGDPQIVYSVEVAPATNQFTSLGETQQFSAEARDESSAVVPGKTFTWLSSDSLVAEVSSSGLGTAVSNGTATFTATTDGVSGTATATVMQSVASVVTMPDSTMLEVGDTTRLSADVDDANGYAVVGALVDWESSAPGVAAVDTAGLVTGVSVGTAYISATSAGLSDTTPATVLSSVSLDTLLFEGFEDTDFASRGWFDNTSLTITSSEFYSGSYALEARFLPAATTPTFGNSARHQFTAAESVYVSYWVKYSANWVGSGQTFHPHEFYLLTNVDDKWIGPAYTHLTAYVESNYQNGGYPVLALQDGRNVDSANIGVDLTAVTEYRAVAGCNGETDGYATVCYSGGGDTYRNVKEWTADSAYFTNGEWHFVEAYFELNSTSGGIGQTDGVVSCWVNGELVFNMNNVLLRTGIWPDMAFNQFLIAPYIGSGSSVDQTMWVDQLLVTNARP